MQSRIKLNRNHGIRNPGGNHQRYSTSLMLQTRLQIKRNSFCFLFAIFLCLTTALSFTISLIAQNEPTINQTAQRIPAKSRAMHITKQYLNIPISNASKMYVFNINVDGSMKRELPLQLADGPIDYWIFIDVGEFKGQTITLSGPATNVALKQIYQDNSVHDAASIYKEANRPKFHFTVKRGWNNDINGPIYYNGQYHLFWQAFPFGVTWDVGFMNWGHAVSNDMIHWKELSPALMLDKIGSPWSGSSVIDHNNSAGWGKDALVLVYATFDRVTNKEVQSIAYSTDNGVTFTHYSGNPILDTNREVGSNDTRDPKVFWYEPTKHWVMVLFEKDGMSFFTSTDLKEWTRQSHFKGLYECPDFFELPVDGDSTHKKWILHGGSSTYSIGSFDGNTFTPESAELHYAEGKNANGGDVLYAAQSFEEMPNGRRVQIAWGRIKQEGMPFNQMMLFPTEFKLMTTKEGLRLRATPIQEIEKLHGKDHHWSSLTAAELNKQVHTIQSQSLDLKFEISLANKDELTIQDQGVVIAKIKSDDLENGKGSIKLLVDKSVAELFLNGGERYIAQEIPTTANGRGTDQSNHPGLEFATQQSTSTIKNLDIYEMKSMRNTHEK